MEEWIWCHEIPGEEQVQQEVRKIITKTASRRKGHSGCVLNGGSYSNQNVQSVKAESI